MNRIISYFILLLAFISCRFPESNGRAIKILNNTSDTIAYLSDERSYDSNNPHMFDSLPDIAHFVEVGQTVCFMLKFFFLMLFLIIIPTKKQKYIYSVWIH